MTKPQPQPINTQVVGKRVLKRDKISLAEVRQLVSSARGGNIKARKQLIDAYCYLPLHLATMNQASADRLADALKIGMEALHVAIDQYQLDYPEHFTGYIRRRVNCRIQSYLRLASKPIKVKRKRLSKYKQQIDFRTETLRVLGKQVKLRLTAQEFAVIVHRYGLNGKDRKTLDEVAELVGGSRQRVHYVECRAIKKLLGDEPG